MCGKGVWQGCVARVCARVCGKGVCKGVCNSLIRSKQEVVGRGAIGTIGGCRGAEV